MPNNIITTQDKHLLKAKNIKKLIFPNLVNIQNPISANRRNMCLLFPNLSHLNLFTGCKATKHVMIMTTLGKQTSDYR